MAENQVQSAQRAGVPRARARFLTQAIELEEQSPGGIAAAGIALTTTLIAGTLVWAHLTPVAEVAHTQGAIVPSARTHKVQHLEGGIVDAIHVGNGDRVERGDVLVELRETQAASELAQVALRQDALEARLRRANALLDGHRSSSDERAQRLPDLQRRLFAEQLTTFREQITLYEAQQRQRHQEIRSKQRQLAALEEEVRLLDERRAIQNTATNLSVVPKVTLLDIQARHAAAVAQVREIESQIEVAREAIREIDQRKVEFTSRWRQDLRLEAEELTAQIDEVSEERRRISERFERLSILAPESGIVLGLDVNTLNEVVEPGQVILEIVPVDDELIAETHVLPRDIGHVHPGQRVDIKVSSYEPQRFGSVPGSLRSVSATTYLDPDQNPYYKAEILLAQNFVGADPGRNQLLPGMTLQADIRTGEKTVLEYILKPVYRGFSGAMQER